METYARLIKKEVSQKHSCLNAKEALKRTSFKTCNEKKIFTGLLAKVYFHHAPCAVFGAGFSQIHRRGKCPLGTAARALMQEVYLSSWASLPIAFSIFSSELA